VQRSLEERQEADVALVVGREVYGLTTAALIIIWKRKNLRGTSSAYSAASIELALQMPTNLGRN
jgi:tRNA C32,U32 (ribose-2'-O)-methylase TrmJ